MSSAALQLPTYDELIQQIRDLPEGSTGEILGPGWLRVMSRPGRKHRGVASNLLVQVDRMGLRRGGGWVIEDEAEIELFDRLYVPDLSGWRLLEGDTTDFLDENPITHHPDWACEILSRSTQAADRVDKLPTYARAGVSHVWVIDSVAQTIEVYASLNGRPTLVASGKGEMELVLPPFEVPFSLPALWAL